MTGSGVRSVEMTGSGVRSGGMTLEWGSLGRDDTVVGRRVKRGVGRLPIDRDFAQKGEG